jgi:tRNA (cytidine/uridine-2'-O-)-methyltransferase
MFNVVLYQPQIPPNTGNIIRLCANTRSKLHLIEPLGFSLDEKSCRRAGLDYRDLAFVKKWESLDRYLEQCRLDRLWAITKFGSVRYDKVSFSPEDTLLFGAETNGLPESAHQKFDSSQKLFIPMSQTSRSMNLSNTVSVIIFEAWRQNNFLSP